MYTLGTLANRVKLNSMCTYITEFSRRVNECGAIIKCKWNGLNYFNVSNLSNQQIYQMHWSWFFLLHLRANLSKRSCNKSPSINRQIWRRNKETIKTDKFFLLQCFTVINSACAYKFHDKYNRWEVFVMNNIPIWMDAYYNANAILSARCMCVFIYKKIDFLT